jgi:hypothetical protein
MRHCRIHNVIVKLMNLLCCISIAELQVLLFRALGTTPGIGDAMVLYEPPSTVWH